MKNSSFNAFDHVNQGTALHLFQDSLDPIILTDRSGTIVKANDRTVDFLNFDRGQLTNLNIADLFQAGQKLPDFSTLPAGSLQVFDGVIPGRQDQDLLHMRVQATHYTLDDTDIVQWIFHDITRQVELDQLRQDLAAMLVHDLQGPLGNVLFSLELVRNELPEGSSETLRSMLEVAYRSSQHLHSLVSSLMDISHLEAGHPLTDLMPVDVRDLVNYVLAVEESDLEQRGIEPSCNISLGLPQVLADESMLQRVLINLLDNALKYSHHGQTIAIKAQLEEESHRVRFSIADQGQGVPEAYRDLIFEKFQRIKIGSSSSGLGLGLAFCRLAVEAHGGRIWVEDAPSGGACFCFTIPVAEDNTSPSVGIPHN